MQFLDLGLDRRHELDRRRAGPDHRHLPATQVQVVVPLRRVEHLALERLDPGKLRVRRFRERTHPGQQHVRDELALARLDPPATVLPVRGLDRMPEADVRADAEPVGDFAQVVLDLGLRRERRRPLRVGREGERVQVRRHVTPAARVRVVPPGAADVVRTLQYDEVVVPGLLEPDRHPDPGEPGPDHHDPVLRGLHQPSSRARREQLTPSKLLGVS